MAAQPTTAITFQNFFSATLTSDITASSTDIPLDAVPNGSEGFLVIEPDSVTNHEVIYYTSKTATKVVCPSVADGRGQDDTTAAAHSSGATVIMAPIAAYFETLLSLFTTTPQGWTALSGTFTSPTYNGNRSYTFTTSVDQTSILSRGMRLRTSRTVAAPTQCADLEASSSQYFSKSSPSGMTFTDDFVVSAWVKLESYTLGTIASRYNGTSGWVMTVLANGQVRLAGFNAGAANSSYVQSYQSLPLGRWVHVAMQLDMSAFTATTTTSYVMIDGADAPATVVRAGTNPTALVQAGDFNIGAYNNASEFLDGKIAQVAIYSAKVTQANIRATISQGLLGTETSLISAYSFNNAITDLNTGNANNLTANGSAVATNADSPFTVDDKGTVGGTYDFGIVTDVTASTITCQVPEGCAIPTSGGISAASYSTYKAPFGMPVERGKWRVEVISKDNLSQASPVSGTWYNINGFKVNLPVGSWSFGWEGYVYASRGNSSGTVEAIVSLSTSTSSETDAELSAGVYGVGASSGVAYELLVFEQRSKPVTVASATDYYLIEKFNSAGGVTLGVFASNRPATKIYAENAYL